MSLNVGAKRTVFGLSLCILLAANSSCVAIPAPAAPWKNVIIEEETLASIEEGGDNRDSLVRLLGTPQLRSPDDSRWVYRTQIYETSNAQLCVAVANGEFGCGRLGEKQHEFLDVRFEPDGTVRSLETKTTDESGCTNSGICIDQWPRELALYAEPQSDDSLGQATQDLCTVYAYLSSDNPAPDFDMLFGDSFAVQLGTDQQVLWVRPEDFINAVVKPGARRFWAINQYELVSQNELMELLAEKRQWSYEEMAAAPWISVDVDCGPNEVRYFELRYERNGAHQILEVDNVRGKQEIAKRRELISMYASEFPLGQLVTPGVKP